MTDTTQTILGKYAYDGFRCKLDRPAATSEKLQKLFAERRKLIANETTPPTPARSRVQHVPDAVRWGQKQERRYEYYFKDAQAGGAKVCGWVL